MDDFGTSFRLANEALSRLHLEYQFKYSRNLTYFRDKMSGQEQAAELLASQVVIMARETPAELFSKSLNEISRRLFELIHSNSMHDRLGAVLGISYIVDCDLEELFSSLPRYANYLRVVLPSKDIFLMREAAHCLGKIFSKGGASVSEMIDFELNRVFQWLSEKTEANQLAACFVLESILLHSNGLSVLYVSKIFDAIWTLMKETKSSAIQESSSKVLIILLKLVSSKYEANGRRAFIQRVLSEIIDELEHSSSQNSLHGSLIILKDLLKFSDDVVNENISLALMDILFQFLNHKSSTVRFLALDIVPDIAGFVPSLFIQKFMPSWIALLVDNMKKDKDRSQTLISLAATASAVGNHIGKYLDSLTPGLLQLLSVTKSKQEEFLLLKAISSMIEATKESFEESAKTIVPVILSLELTEATLKPIVLVLDHIPLLVPFLEEKVIWTISRELNSRNQNRINLALKVASNLAYHGSFLILPLSEKMFSMFEDSSLEIETRYLSIKAIISGALKITKPELFCEQYADIEQMLQRVLLTLLLLNSNEWKLLEDVSALLTHPKLEQHWMSDANFSALMSLFSIGSYKTKLVVIQILKMLVLKNRALIRPHFRNNLAIFLSNLVNPSTEDETRHRSSLLCEFVMVDASLINPYIGSIIKLLMPKLTTSDEESCISIMKTLNYLIEVSPNDFIPSIFDLVKFLTEIFQDLSSDRKRYSGLQCLGTLLRNIDRELIPSSNFVTLIHELTFLIKMETVRVVRNEALKLLGIVGAIDPYKMRSRELEMMALDLKEGGSASITDEIALIIDGLVNPDEQYPLVAVNVLLKILKDSSMSNHYIQCTQSLVYIFRSVKVKGSVLLPYVFPVLTSVLKASSSHHLEFYFQSISNIVSSVSLHIRPFVTEIVNLIHQFWGNATSSLLNLIESLIGALKGEFNDLLVTLIFPCVLLLKTEKDMGPKVVRVLSCFGPMLSNEIETIFQTYLDILQESSTDMHLAILKSILRLFLYVDFSNYIPIFIKILLPSLKHHDPRIREASTELYSLLMKSYEIILRPYQPVLLKLISEGSLNANQKAESVTSVGKTSTGYNLLHGNSSVMELDHSPSDLTVVSLRKLPVNEPNLRRAWESFIYCTTKDDWFEWMRKLGLEFIRESPSQSIRSCSQLASTHYPIVRDLFNVAFLSCWNEFSDDIQDELVGALEEAFSSQTVPPEVVQTLLNLAEFLEHDERPLPIDITTLGRYAIKCHAYAKALYYKEMEFQSNPSASLVESLISLNSQIQLPDAASGILSFAQKRHGIVLKESWYEKLQRWDQALAEYERKLAENPDEMEALLGVCRCRQALGDWGNLNEMSTQIWKDASEDIKNTVAPWAASSAWSLAKWDQMKVFTEKIDPNTVDGSFFRAILAVKDNDIKQFEHCIASTREFLDTELIAMISESYNRAYRTTVRVQMLSELEEVLEYKKSEKIPERREVIKKTWFKRLLDCQESVDVWQNMLKVRSLVLHPNDEEMVWIKFASLCRRMQRPLLSKHVLLGLLDVNESEVEQLDLSKASPPAMYSLLKHYWDVGETQRAVKLMRQYSKLLVRNLDMSLNVPGQSMTIRSISPSNDNIGHSSTLPADVEKQTKLLAKCFVRLGNWQKSLCLENNEDISDLVMDSFLMATSYDKNSYKAWHGWALTNFEMASVYEKQKAVESRPLRSNPYIVPAIQGFFRSISLSSGDAFQDSLRLLTLWFKYGSQPEVNASVGDGFHSVPVDNWLQVIPQLIARIHVPSPQVRRLVQHVLSEIGRHHPNALLYPLTVASKSQSISRRTSALTILDKMRSHSAVLVEQTVMVSQELIRMAISWEEMWYEALEEASKLYFGDHNIAGMFSLLEPLHKLMERNRETQRENQFFDSYGSELKAAQELCQKYKQTGNADELTAAWDFYYQVFKKISKKLPQLIILDLASASPKLLNAKDLEIPIPGTYKANCPIVKISSVAPMMSVIASKQRPRKLILLGSDGQKYKFLLKGHEDLRQDERVMQFFGLVNSLLASDGETSKRHLSIERFSVVPLSQNTGLIGWVSHCDTIHTLIRDYREARGILLSAEHRMMLQFAPDYDQLTELQKVEVFDHALANIDGLDLNRIMWKKSKNAETWLDRRTTFTRSLAVMSMVGYVLGLGDRHPSNLMIDQVTGKVIHIDFGDCFEVAMHREKFPEKVPFRLTRMLIKAMEVSQVEGTFRIVSEHTMRVLRNNRDSLMAVLEAFVYDPLINWRLLTKPSEPLQKQSKIVGTNYTEYTASDSTFPENFSTKRHVGRADITRLEEESVNRPEALNAGALNVINRVSNKLTGRDFQTVTPLDVPRQVDLLIQEAIKVENLCQSYVGWCPFW